MERTPTFSEPISKVIPPDSLRNFWCPHYEVCLNEAARLDYYLDCSECLYRDARVPDVSFVLNMP